MIKKDRAFVIGSPAIVWQILFFYVPLVFIIFSSVISFSVSGEFEKITFDNFIELFQWPYFKVILNSIFLGFSVAAICICIAYPFAYYVAFFGRRLRYFYLFLLIVPFWTNFLLHVYAWYYVLEKEGVVNQLLLSLKIIQEPISFLNSPFAIILMMVYYYLPFTVLPIYSALERFDKNLIEVSLDLGASFRKTFIDILLPITIPSIQAAFFLVFIPAFGEFIIPELMGGDKIYFVGNVLTLFILGEETESLAAAFTVMSAAALLVATLFFYWFISKITRSRAEGD